VAERAELERALDFIREGDILVVAKLDRLARSMRDLMKIVDHIKGKTPRPKPRSCTRAGRRPPSSTRTRS